MKKNFTSYKDIIKVVSNLGKRKEEKEKRELRSIEKYQFLNSCHRFLATFAFPISCTFLSFFPFLLLDSYSNICNTHAKIYSNQQFNSKAYELYDSIKIDRD